MYDRFDCDLKIVQWKRWIVDAATLSKVTNIQIQQMKSFENRTQMRRKAVTSIRMCALVFRQYFNKHESANFVRSIDSICVALRWLP